MGFLDFVFQRSPTFSTTDDGITSEMSQNVSLKNGALYKVSHYVGRGVSRARFVFKGRALPDSVHAWDYLLNVRPNPNQTAANFWAEVGVSLIENGEVLLVVLNQSLYLADSYSKEEASLTGDSFRVATIQGQMVDKVFRSDEVMFISNENAALTSYLEALWADYGELFGRLINRQKTANQLRFTFIQPKNKVKELAQESQDGAAKGSKQRFFERVMERIRTDSVVGIPLTDKSVYQEFSDNSTTRQSYLDDMDKLQKQYVDDICELIGLPAALLHGELADNRHNYDLAVETVFEPLLSKVCDCLQEAVFSKDDYQAGCRIKVVGLRQYQLFDVATAGDKLIAAGLAMADEIREEIGLEPLPDGLGQKLYITKNYLEMKGGDNDEENDNQN